MSGNGHGIKWFAFSLGTIEKSFITSIFFGTLTVGLSKLLTFILKLYVARLGVGSFGDYYFSTSTFTGLATLSALGIPMSVTRFVSYLRGKKQDKQVPTLIASGISLVTITTLVFGVCMFIFSGIFAETIHAPNMSRYFRLLSIAVLGAGITQVVRAAFLGAMKIRAAYAAEMYELALRFVCTVIGMAIFQEEILGAVIGYAIGTIIGALINLFLIKKYDWVKFYPPLISRDLVRYAVPVGASEIITALTGIILLSWLRAGTDAFQVGLYGAAVAVASLIHVIPQMVFAIFLPVVSERFAQKKSITILYGKLLMWLVIAVLVPAYMLHVFRVPLLSLLFGDTYTAAASTLTFLLIAYSLYALMVWPNRQLLDMSGYTSVNLGLTVLRTISCLLFIYASGKNINGELVAYAITAGWIVEACGSIFFVRQNNLFMTK